MSTQIKIIQDKDTWNYTEECKSNRGIYAQDERFFDSALLCMFNDGDLMQIWDDCRTNEERKKVIWNSILNEIDSLKETLKYDLDKNVKIYPLIKKKVK